MKIPLKAFLLSLCWSLLISFASYFPLWFLCRKYAGFMLPFVFLVSILICIVLCYFSAVHFKVFKITLKSYKLCVTKGFIIRRKKYLNLSFVLSVKNFSTPLMRFLKLDNILLLVEGSVCLLPLLKAEDAEVIYESIVKNSEKNEKI